MLATKNTYIQSAYNTLQVISQDEDEEKRIEYETREKALRDYNQGMLEAEQRGEERGRTAGEKVGMEKGREIGEQEKTIQIAKNMLAIGLLTDVIAQSTGLSIAQIESL